MANFIYRPYREIVIHEIREMEIQPFMEGYVSQLRCSQGQAGITPVATWVDGVAFYIGNFMETPEMVKEKLEGRIHSAAGLHQEPLPVGEEGQCGRKGLHRQVRQGRCQSRLRRPHQVPQPAAGIFPAIKCSPFMATCASVSGPSPCSGSHNICRVSHRKRTALFRG